MTGGFTRLLLALIMLLVFAFSLRIAIDILQRIPHVQDSVTYLFQAQTLARGRLVEAHSSAPRSSARRAAA